MLPVPECLGCMLVIPCSVGLGIKHIKGLTAFAHLACEIAVDHPVDNPAGTRALPSPKLSTKGNIKQQLKHMILLQIEMESCLLKYFYLWNPYNTNRQ